MNILLFMNMLLYMNILTYQCTRLIQVYSFIHKIRKLIEVNILALSNMYQDYNYPNILQVY